MTTLHELWAVWDSNGRRERDLNALLRACRYAADRYVGQLGVPEGPNHEDMVADAMEGTLQALETFDPARGTKFQTFVQQRFKGAIFDAKRSADFLPVWRRKRVTKLLRMEEKLQVERGRVATDEELAAELGVTVEIIAAIRRDALTAHTVAWEERGADGDQVAHGPLAEQSRAGNGTHPGIVLPVIRADETIDFAVLHQRLSAALATLTGSEHVVMVLFYIEEMTMKEIGEELGVSASMVSKIRDRAYVKVLAALRAG